MNVENPFERLNNWMRNSVMLKLITIAILTLLLLIPASMIESTIKEREGLNMQAIEEVSAIWAREQQLNGPVLAIPLIYEYKEEDKVKTITKHLFILPENLVIDGSISPEKLHRGIYEIVVYKSSMSVGGSFKLDQEIDQTNLKEIQFDKAFLTIGISDMRGIKNNIAFTWGGHLLGVEPGSRIGQMIRSGVSIDIPDLGTQMGSEVDFSFDLELHGSQNLSYVPIGSKTDVRIESEWSSPSFNGNFLPASREVTEEGFKAYWSILELNRNYPQSWIAPDQPHALESSAFGVDLLLPMDDYQKSMRSAKYAIMTIALTFLVFFLVEIITKRRIHPFQYVLVGLALCLFYVLLVSISEQLNFNLAYLISMLGIVSMVVLYSLSVFRKQILSMVLVTVLLGIYGFLFVTLQLTDYALLMGSVGLTLILAATMYFTRNIDWYKLNRE
ncbi:MAG: cell envelope integrity protein CreD [Cyclobacteriaceae bacterium]|nr:cell envelope integrity protein CreD [Cyclobacteriaceae bacterium SS2]